MAGKTRAKEEENGVKNGSAPTGDMRDERFRILSENSPVGVCIIEDRLFTYVNSAFADMFSYGADELVGIKGPKDTVFPQDWPSVGNLVKTGASDGSPAVRLQFRGVKKDGRLIDVELHVSKTTHQKHPFSLVLFSILQTGRRPRKRSRRRTEAFRILLISFPTPRSSSTTKSASLSGTALPKRRRGCGRRRS